MRKASNEELFCHVCEVAGTWDSGSSKGSLYECEFCSEIVCFDCLSMYRPFSGELSRVVCPSCQKHGLALREALSQKQSSGEFDGYPEESVDFFSMDSNELFYYLDWLDEEQRKEVESLLERESYNE